MVNSVDHLSYLLTNQLFVFILKLYVSEFSVKFKNDECKNESLKNDFIFLYWNY